MKIYLAARYSRRVELCEYRAELQALGHVVPARWLNGEHQISDAGLAVLGSTGEAAVEGDSQAADMVALRSKFAQDDWDDLSSADIVVSFSEPPRSSASRGGRHVEFGAAMALRKTCVVVGPRENVFHCLPGVEVFAAWPAALAYLTTLSRSV